MKRLTERFTVAVALTAGIAAAVHATRNTTADVWRGAMAYQYQLPGGQTDIIPEDVAILKGPADIRKLRQAAGADCVMCHGK